MDDRGTNIDFVFRNGLKDYEVLPPSDVWDRISPVIHKRQRSLIIFRAAAFIAVVLSLSILAYRWGRVISTVQQENMQAQITESAIVPASDNIVALPGYEGRNSTILLSDASLSDPQVLKGNSPAENVVIQSIENPSTSDFMPDRGLSSAGSSELIKINNPFAGVPETAGSDYLPEEVTAIQNETRRWSLTALISPSYYSRVSTGNNEAMAQIMTSEHPLVSYSGGMALSYNINKRVSIQSGLYYSSIGQQLSGISAYSGFEKYQSSKGAGFSVITATGTVSTNNADVFLLDNNNGDKVIGNYSSDVVDPVKAELQYIDNSLRQNFSYLELPLIIRYKVIDKTLDFNLIGGFSSNLLVNNKVSAFNNGDKYQVGMTEGLNIFTFSSSLGMGMEYNFSRNLSLNLEPTLRYYLNPFGAIPGMKIHPYSFGIFSGLSYRF